MSQPSQTAPIRRLNPSAVIVLAVAAVALVAAVVARKVYLDRHDSGMFLREARQRLDARQPALALGYLNRHLAGHPDDVDALDLKAKVLSDEARDAYEAIDAIQVHTQVLGRDPDGPKRQETRRRLVELNLKVGGRARTAEILARDLIRRGSDDARSHRLLALALEGVADDGDAKARTEAASEYEAALKLDPGAVDVAERLARLCRDKLNDPERAGRVLDDLVKANRDDPARLGSAHLARSRFFAGSGQPARASDEVASGLKAHPTDPALRIAAAEEAVGRGDLDEARRHLKAIPDDARGDLRIKLVEGLIELNEQRPDEAIQSWRAGLLQTGGNNSDLSWRLAHVLLDIGRVAEAEPLIAQYRRLVGGDDPDPLYRYLVGFSLLKKGRPAEAIAELETIRYKVGKALEPHLHYLLGQCFEKTGDRLNAVSAYKRATVLSPRWSDPWLAIARLQGNEHPEEAITTLEQGLTVAPDDPRLMAALSLALGRRQLRRPASQRSWTEVEATLSRGKKAAPRSIELTLAEADYLASVGRDDDALARLRDASRMNPRSVPLWLARANGLRRLGRGAEALAVLDQATASVGPQSGFAMIRASLLADLGHIPEARAALLAALDVVPAEQQPALWTALGELARLAEHSGRPAEAETLLRDLLKHDPALGWARRSLALILAGRSGDRAAWDEALRVIGPSARADDLPDDRLARARVYAMGPESRHRQEAIRILEELASELPDAATVHERLARLLRDAGQANRARAHAARAATGPSASPDAILLYASTLLNPATLDEAERQLDRLAAIDPSGLPVAEVRARILSARGRGDEAAGVLERAFAARVDSPGGLAVGEKMIGLLVELNQPKAAERVARRVAKLGPGGACVLARFLAPRGRPDEAADLIDRAGKAGDPLAAGTAALALALAPGGGERWIATADRLLDAAVKVQPGSPDPLLRLAIVRHLQGRYADQIAIYQSILDHDPGGCAFLNDMAWVLSEDLGRPEEGLERIDQAVQRVGREAHVLDTRGVILTRLGRLDAAIKDLEEAAAALPTGPFYFHLARAYQRKGREDGLRKAFDAARRLGLRVDQLQPSERDEWQSLMHN